MIVSEIADKPQQYFDTGVKATAIKFKRPFPRAKHTYHAAAIQALSEAKDQDITEVIYFDVTQVFEAGGSNIFAVLENTLITPKSNIVEGLIRNTLLDILHLSIPVEVRDFTYPDLLSAQEVFITNSQIGSIGVVEINGNTIGNGIIGEITKEASEQYKSYIHSFNY